MTLLLSLFLCGAGSVGILGDQLTLLNLSNIVPQDATSETFIWYSKSYKTSKRLVATLQYQ